MKALFDSDIRIIKGVGVSRAKLFNKLGVTDVGALLHFYPRTYEDWSSVTTLAQAATDKAEYIKGRLVSPITEHRIRKGMTLYRGWAADDNGSRFRLTFFNNPYVGSLLRPEREYVFRGKLTAEYGHMEMSSPEFRDYDPDGGLEAIYHQTEGLNSRAIAKAVRFALDMIREDMPDPLPERLRVLYRMPDLKSALRGIHFPKDSEELAAARRRLIFEELLVLQLGLLKMKAFVCIFLRIFPNFRQNGIVFLIAA